MIHRSGGALLMVLTWDFEPALESNGLIPKRCAFGNLRASATADQPAGSRAAPLAAR